MTGQVDEAGRGDDELDEITLDPGDLGPHAPYGCGRCSEAAEVAGLRTQLDAVEQEREAWKATAKSSREMWVELMIDFESLSAERDGLAGQVAAIRALHGKVPEPFLDGERYSCSTCTDGEGNAIDWPCPTLVASSPTTPEAKK